MPPEAPTAQITRERWHLLRQFERMLEMPMVALGFVWLVLLVLDLLGKLSPAGETVNNVIWGVFVLDFALKFVVAPAKLEFLKRNWLVAISLALPALRIFRITRAFRLLRLARGARAVRFARILTGFNRALRSFRATMRRRGLGYVLGLTGLVAVSGAAGMYAFEHDAGQSAGFESYASALWWTLMLLTSLGSEYWPRTGAGRALCLFLAIYGFAVFGYITAALASYFIGRDTEKPRSTATPPAQP